MWVLRYRDGWVRKRGKCGLGDRKEWRKREGKVKEVLGDKGWGCDWGGGVGKEGR